MTSSVHSVNWWGSKKSFIDSSCLLIASGSVPFHQQNIVKVLKAYALETGVPETNWDEGVNKAVDKYYGSKYDKAKTDECHVFLEGLIPNGKERVNKVVQTLY